MAFTWSVDETFSVHVSATLSYTIYHHAGQHYFVESVDRVGSITRLNKLGEFETLQEAQDICSVDVDQFNATGTHLIPPLPPEPPPPLPPAEPLSPPPTL